MLHNDIFFSLRVLNNGRQWLVDIKYMWICVYINILETSSQNYHKYKIGLRVHHLQEIAIFQSFFLPRLHSNELFAIFVKSKLALLSELLPGNESHNRVAVVWLQLFQHQVFEEIFAELFVLRKKMFIKWCGRFCNLLFFFWFWNLKNKTYVFWKA